ncbi:PsbQ-like protein 2, chloroplastic [Apostasia shenzhenica]|uniref:PsbQ-like protein 2, chloroplastic n=1 Tax=Apostasia shenzhenica TaxID=1088818 RepID=A0A2H9ZSX1_9ASPA|nr:PsbQ-like protein 2, chloroplastic [Apostasia shenzhenica]
MAQSMASTAGVRGPLQAVLEGGRQQCRTCRVARPSRARDAGSGIKALMLQGKDGREVKSNRRAMLSLFAAGVAGGLLVESVMADENPVMSSQQRSSSGNPNEEGNGLWLPGFIPIPTVANKINNPQTGTRSFVTNGVYVANIGPRGSAFRIKHNAFDLLGWGDLLGQNAWSYLKRYLQLKSTIMYFDFDTIITAAPDEQKQLLTDLANRLFNNFEKVEAARSCKT